MEKESQLEIIGKELTRELASPEVKRALLETTFKKFTPELMHQAMFEGMLRGYTFQDFLQKNVYAIKYGSGYSLVTSIDRARKIGMKSNVVGTTEPTYEENGETLISCSITVKRKFGDYIGDFSAKAYFKEYFKPGTNYDGKYVPSMWDNKPRTMIAKVAEMMALRKACPEELSQSYVEEEMQAEVSFVDTLDEKIKTEVNSIKTLAKLQEYYEKNKGKGKEFDKCVMARKKELTDEKK